MDGSKVFAGACRAVARATAIETHSPLKYKFEERMAKAAQKHGWQWSKASFWALLFITIVCVFVPPPLMPAAGPDASYVLGINQAVAQGLAFGSEIIFTFGPYASILTKAYHPATDYLMLAGAFYLGISYGTAVFFLSSNNKWYLIFALSTVLAWQTFIRDPLFLSYPLLAGLFCFNLMSHSGIDCRDKKTLVQTAIIFFPLGLLPLIKGTLLILSASIVVLATALFLSSKRWYLAIIVLVSSMLSALFFWTVVGQSVLHLPNYFISTNEIARGYTEAMAKNGSAWEIFAYLIAAFSLMTAAFFEKASNLQTRLFLLCAIFVFLFASFKAGFVRNDGHAVIGSGSLLIGALLLSLSLRSMQIWLALCVSAVACIYIDWHYVSFSGESIYQNIRSSYSPVWTGVKDRITRSNSLRAAWNNAIAGLKEGAKFPVLQGTTDIYSFDQSYLIASGNLWNPRPVLQSYSAYTPKLAEKNRNHLLGGRAPDNVIFKVEPLDGRLPSLEDGASWPVLLTRYQPTALENGFLFLHRLPFTSGQSQLQPLAGDGIHKFGDVVAVPNVASPVFAELAIRPSILGRLADVFFKSNELQISLNLEDGTTKTYRIIAEMAKSEFMLSPLVQDTIDFALLYGGRSYLGGRAVKSFVIVPVGGAHFWDGNYQVTFKQINLPPEVDIPNLYKFDPIGDDNSARPISIAERCDGSIELINGASPRPSGFTASGLLKVDGWLAKSVADDEPAQSVLVVLTDGNGRNTFIKTRQVRRPDVAMYLRKPALEASGYTSVADTSTLDGKYRLGLAFAEGNRIERCPQFNIPVTLKRVRS
jgi:hypothetical protein